MLDLWRRAPRWPLRRVISFALRLDSIKLKRAQRVLETRTETETVERALELAISEYERNRVIAKANQNFVRSGIVIRDVFGTPALGSRCSP
jgi:hypothetical protein